MPRMSSSSLPHFASIFGCAAAEATTTRRPCRSRRGRPRSRRVVERQVLVARDLAPRLERATPSDGFARPCVVVASAPCMAPTVSSGVSWTVRVIPASGTGTTGAVGASAPSLPSRARPRRLPDVCRAAAAGAATTTAESARRRGERIGWVGPPASAALARARRRWPDDENVRETRAGWCRRDGGRTSRSSWARRTRPDPRAP